MGHDHGPVEEWRQRAHDLARGCEGEAMTVDFAVGAPVAGDLNVRWIYGAAGEPPVQVHAYDPHTYLLRQSKGTNYEAPFLYLLFGNARAVLLDTGATKDADVFPLRQTVDGLVDG